jgi:hypothetical protein
VIRTGLYLTSAEPANRRGILRIAPTNAAPAVLVGVAPYLPEVWTWTLRAVSIVLVYTTNARGTARGMAIQPDHFVERHGLIVLIVLGESIVAIGIGAAGAPVDLPLVAGATLGIALAASIWSGRTRAALVVGRRCGSVPRRARATPGGVGHRAGRRQGGRRSCCRTGRTAGRARRLGRPRRCHGRVGGYRHSRSSGRATTSFTRFPGVTSSDVIHNCRGDIHSLLMAVRRYGLVTYPGRPLFARSPDP